LLKKYRKLDYDKAMTQKEGISGPVTGAKMRVLSMIFNSVGIKQSDYQHGYARGVYYSCFYENTKEFLCRKITEDKLVMKPLFSGDVDEILKFYDRAWDEELNKTEVYKHDEFLPSREMGRRLYQIG
jgi:hypothetical protein